MIQRHYEADRTPQGPLVRSEEERGEFVRLTQRARVNRNLAFRAKLVLACGDGITSTELARQCRTSNQTVCKWRKRFVEQRLDSLYDEPRVGAPRKISDNDVEAIIVKTLETTPKGRTHWSTRKMAAQVGVSHTMVGRIWRTFGLKPHRTLSFKLSPDPQLIAKVRDVVGLYMNPPGNAAGARSTKSPRFRHLSVRNPYYRWTSASPSAGRTTMSAAERSISSPRSTSPLER